MAALSASEVEVFDRQIRLWGAQAQQRLMQSKLLVWGLDGSNIEAAKNLVLAGIALTVRDHRAVTPEDRAFNYFLRTEDVGKNRAASAAPRLQEMAPLVKVAFSDAAPEKDAAALKKGLEGFHVVLVSSTVLADNFEVACAVDDYCREAKAAMFLTMSSGQLSFFFSDMGAHTVRERSSPQGGAGSVHEQQEAPEPEDVAFPSLRDWLAVAPSELLSKKVDSSVRLFVLLAQFLRSPKAAEGGGPAAEGAGARFEAFCKDAKCAPEVDGVSLVDAYELYRLEPLLHVASVLGGLLAQEVIKAITNRDLPLVNSVCFSAFTNSAMVERVPAEQRQAVKRKVEEAALDLDSD